MGHCSMRTICYGLFAFNTNNCCCYSGASNENFLGWPIRRDFGDTMGYRSLICLHIVGNSLYDFPCFITNDLDCVLFS